MPVIRKLDPTAGPMAFFGAELRRRREAAGLSQEQLGAKLNFTGSQVGKVETGERPPSLDFAKRCDEVFPEADGIFERLYALAQRWEGSPAWFRPWLEIEREATLLRWWEPLLIPGLLQTADYARAILGASPSTSDDGLDDLVSARIERQSVLDGPECPMLCAVIDESVLYRCIGSPKIMHDGLLHLAEMSRRKNITVQVVPGKVGAHAGLLGAFIIARLDGGSDIVYLETPSSGQTDATPSVVHQINLAWEALRSVALPIDDSRDLILKVAEERWTD